MSPEPKQMGQSSAQAGRRRLGVPLFPASIALALLVAAVLVLVGLQLMRPLSAGELAFNPESIDLGRVPLGQAAPFRYAMRNVGAQPVRITSKPKVAAIEGC